MDAREGAIGQTLRFEPLDASRMRFLRSERADIEAVARKRMGKRRVVDLGIVRERDERGIAINAERRQCDVRPFGDHLHVGETLDRGKRGARIDNGHVIAQKARDGRERLADVHGAGNDELRGRNVHGEEDLPRRRLHHATPAAPDVLFDHLFERIARHFRRLDQALLAGRHIGDDHRRAACRAFGVQRSEDLELHDSPCPALGASPPPLRGRVREGGTR